MAFDPVKPPRPPAKPGEEVVLVRLAHGFRLDFGTVDARGRPVIIRRIPMQDLAKARTLARMLAKETGLPLRDLAGEDGK